MRFFNRASNGDLVLASHVGRASNCWVWAVFLSRRKQRLHIAPKAERRGQWHHFIPLPFGRTLIFSRQDYHRDPRHRRAA